VHRRLRHVPLLILAVAACGRSKTPSQAPAPAGALQPAGDGGANLPPVPVLDPFEVSISDVTRSAVAIFGDSIAAVPVDSTPIEGEEEVPTWDLDVRSYETHERVEHYIRLFTGTARERIVTRLERGSQYEPMIRAKFRAGGIPEDMYYLGLVESGYDPHAYSRAAAVGMWQFMTTTARGVGLRVDWWVDDRRDPVRSTDAAVRFLRTLREQFGSMYLAAAAYNGGPGRVSRGLTRFSDEIQDAEGDDRFFALAETDYLRAETRNYVPQLIAAALIAKEPRRYGLSLRTLPRFSYDSVLVPGSTPLTAVARAAGVPLDEVKSLNSRVLRGVTPPGAQFEVRLPPGAGASFDSVFAALPDSARIAFHKVTTKKGQSVASLAKAHGVSARHIAWYNPKMRKLKSGNLAAGQTVLVPSTATVAGALDVPDPSVEIYGSSRTRSGARVHVVKRGESLGLIAKRYGTTTSAIMRRNGMRKNVIYPGQRLVVGGSAPRKSSTRSASSKSASKAK
jgi:membrane-bound lytic murein transglycosylase D